MPTELCFPCRFLTHHIFLERRKNGKSSNCWCMMRTSNLSSVPKFKLEFSKIQWIWPYGNVIIAPGYIAEMFYRPWLLTMTPSSLTHGWQYIFGKNMWKKLLHRQDVRMAKVRTSRQQVERQGPELRLRRRAKGNPHKGPHQQRKCMVDSKGICTFRTS